MRANSTASSRTACGAEQDSLTHARSGMTNDLGTQLGQQFKEQIYGALR